MSVPDRFIPPHTPMTLKPPLTDRARIQRLENTVEDIRKAVVLLCSHQTYDALELVRDIKR